MSSTIGLFVASLDSRRYRIRSRFLPTGTTERPVSEKSDPDVLCLSGPRDLGRRRPALQLSLDDETADEPCGLGGRVG